MTYLVTSALDEPTGLLKRTVAVPQLHFLRGAVPPVDFRAVGSTTNPLPEQCLKKERRERERGEEIKIE